jgi:hypothetical protein
MRRNSSTVVVLAGQVPGEVLAAATRSLNVTLYQPEAPPAQEGTCRSSPVRPHRVVLVLATEPAQQAAGVLHALGSLRHGPWWPGLDQVIETARRFYPASLSETDAATLAGGPGRAG